MWQDFTISPSRAHLFLNSLSMRSHRLPSYLQRAALSAAIVGALALMAPPAFAQTDTVVKPAPPVKKEEAKPPPQPAADAPIDATVTVTAERPTNRIDRQSYDIKNDVSATNASAADALNNVPSVSVDPDGTVSLRGSTNVQILIDGKPSPMMQGDNRGPTLNSLPAEDIESVEVINNPGAQFGNEGGGGPILNLVMRRNRKPGGMASLTANRGTAGRYNSAVSGSYNSGAFGLQGGLNLRHDGRNSTGAADRVRIDPLSGAASRSSQDSVSRGLNDSAGANVGITYNLGDNDTLGASVAVFRRNNNQLGDDRYINFGQDDVADSDYARSTRRSGNSNSYTVGARLEHKGDVSGELFKLDLRLASTDNETNNAYLNTYVVRPPGRLDVQSRQENDNATRFADFTGDYERPIEGGAFVRLGFKAARHQSNFDTLYTNIDPATLAETPNAARSNRYALDEDTLALYGSYQMRLNERWGVMAGLRTEYTRMNIDSMSGASTADNSYANFIPSFFATYKATDATNIRFSYAHRIRRPNASDLNPFVVYRDEFNVSSGNPNLRPTESDSLELGFETRFGALDTNLRAYYRRDHDLISERKAFISDTVLLTTRDNDGSNRSGGLEFTLSGKLLPTLTLNASGNLGVTEQRVFNGLVFTDEKRTARSLSGRTRLNYQISAADQLQVSLNAQGKTLFGQGYRQPNTTTNLSYRHTLTPALSLVLNVTDVFDSNKIETITDSALLQETSLRRSQGRIVYLGLSYRLGGVAGAQQPGGRGGQRGPGGGGGGRPMPGG
jgi:outer membrane receptor protein involved in Fe transport